MEAGARVVVTGAGGGIGRAIAVRLAGEGARVVVSDLRLDDVQSLADEIGAHAVAADMSTAEGVASLVDESRRLLDGIDVFFANAGVDWGRDLDTPDEVWAGAFDVNLMSHVRAARLLVPDWIESGGGRFVITASAAGLLTMIGSAPYSASKHAAVAFAEWLSVMYGSRGVVVQAICPLGVRTRMLESDVAGALLARDAISPEELADAVWEALQGEQFLILPHPQVADFYARRATDTDGWLSAMRHLADKVRTGVE